MRTLQEKYNAIQEGKFTKDQFLRDARLEQPNLVTRFNGYDDAVQILKNRGMIQEAKVQEAAPRTMQAGFDMVSAEVKKHRELMRVANKLFPEFGGNLQNLKPLSRQQREIVYQNVDIANIKEADINSTPSFEQWKNIATKNAQTFKSQLAKVGVDSEMPFSLAFKRLSDKQKQQVYNNVINNKLDKVVASKLQEAKQPKLTKKALADYRYKPTNDLDKYPYEQILRGLRVELETMNVVATPTAEEYTKALAKVLKNLEKDSIFYTNQVAGVKPTKKRTDIMVDATPKNEVDKDNGLQKAQLKEAFKGLIKKILSEGNEFGEGEEVYEMQSAKSDDEYKSELAEYLEDNQIYGYTDRIHNIMTGPDEADALDRLADYLKEEGIYGYNRGIERIYADYPYDQHWENQPDEDEDFPEIPGFEGTRDALDNLFEDNEADKNMVRKFMTMYETEPSKFEKLHKQAQVQAKTTKDIKFKHLLSLLDRAKAGALQSLSNQDKFEADREGMEEGYNEDKIAKFEKYTYTLDGKVVKPEIAFFDHILGAELDGEVYKIGIPDETGTVELGSHKGKTGMYTEDVFESVSLFDILDEGSSKHSREWFKGYRAFNERKKRVDNPYKQSPQKEDWADGWEQAQFHAADAYKGY